MYIGVGSRFKTKKMVNDTQLYVYQFFIPVVRLTLNMVLTVFLTQWSFMIYYGVFLYTSKRAVWQFIFLSTE